MSGKEIKKLYCSSIDEAVDELKKRRAERGLLRQIEEFLGNDLPSAFQTEPRAVLVCYIASPSIETHYFGKKAKKSGLKPLFLEYSRDKFVARNLMKYYLCKMHAVDLNGKKLGKQALRIIDFQAYEGKRFIDVKTLWNESLVNFHHKLFELHDTFGIEVDDFSDWFEKHRKISHYYYLHYLSLFIAHGILFENFLQEKGEEDFTRDIVIPAFREVERVFGLKPLIVPLEPVRVENNDVWHGYPEEIMNLVSLQLEKVR